MKILLHIDQTERWNAVLSNLKNMINAKKTHPDLKVEVVVTGDAIQNLILNKAEIEFCENLKKATDADFDIMGCHNSMNRFNLAEKDIFSFVKIVPAGLLEIAEKENAGWAYVKP
ncbi:DsrE family protein [Ligilactobacillus cholophilus]|uniref:DsrE family protein n=1 Tax=Ligilactobacillus cholophilus TaxID=3050131 RepID=UPI0025AFCA16|nr:DsrE family protein [Ligilactobacillus cholophilus]